MASVNDNGKDQRKRKRPIVRPVTVKGPHVQVFKDRSGEYRFRRVASNGQKTSASEGYASRQGARRAARQNHPDVPVLSLF